MPVPIVKYRQLDAPLAAPQRYSPNAAVLTSVSKPTWTGSEARRVPTRSVFCQPGFGVDVMYPYVGEAGSRSQGPKAPIPILRRPWLWQNGLKNSTAFRKV